MPLVPLWGFELNHCQVGSTLIPQEESKKIAAPRPDFMTGGSSKSFSSSKNIDII